jgi:hypothetical protein
MALRARTRTSCWPSVRPASGSGDVAGAYAPPSTLTSKVAPTVLEANASDAVV